MHQIYHDSGVEFDSLRLQLECWRAGIVEFWVLEKWYDGS